MAWQRLRVRIKGQDPIDVQTNARDFASVIIDPSAPKALDLTFRIAHNALMRMGVDNVPRDYEGFLEVLDAIPESLDGEDASLLDPTQQDR